MAPTPPRMDSTSAPAAGPDPAATSTPSTGSTPAWSSTPPQSGQYGSLHTQVISATASEAPYVLDGLHPQAHQTSLRIAEHYTPTPLAPPTTCSVCATLLGHRFSPRIKDLKERKLYAVEKPDTYPVLKPLIGEPVDTAAPGPRLGRADAGQAFHRGRRRGPPPPSCASSPRLDRTTLCPGRCGPWGRIQRTLFTLQWLSDPALRQRSHAGAEQRRGGQRACAGRCSSTARASSRDRTFENQGFRASGLSLLTTAIVHWNTVYLDQAVRHLRSQGANIPDELLAHVAPLGWETHRADRRLRLEHRATHGRGCAPLRAVPEAFTPPRRLACSFEQMVR